MLFGFPLGPFSRYPSVHEVAELACAAEDAGFHHVTMGEHVILPASVQDAFGPVWFEPLTLAAFLAARTQRIRILFSVLVLPYHNPVRLAKAVATVDQISRGRLSIGLGAGWLEPEFQMANAPFKQRGTYTDESIQLMQRLWDTDPVTFHGAFFQVEDAISQPKPVQKPHPPIWVGGTGKVSMRRAVTYGAGWHPMNRPLESLAAEALELHEMLRASGRAADSVIVSASVDYGAVHEGIQRHNQLNKAAPSNLISGSLDEQLAAIERYQRAGIGHLLIRPGTDDLDAVKAALARIGREIIPRFP